MTSKFLIVPPIKHSLNVKGTGLSIPASPSVSPDYFKMSRSHSYESNDDDDRGETSSYTALDGVREMNHMLVRQIETLRLKIKTDEKNHLTERSRILESKETEIRSKETEIDQLKESLANRDEKIHDLTRCSNQKDKIIQGKSLEIDDLKRMVEKTNEYARRIRMQVSRTQSKGDKPDDEISYKQQTEEIIRLNEELDLMKTRLAALEEELERALQVIEEQDERLQAVDADKQAIQSKFKEDLDKASKEMRQEVERMREVMVQNYEEMKMFRQQHKVMQDDVRAIRNFLMTSQAEGENEREGKREDNLFTISGNQTTAHQPQGQTSVVATGPGKMINPKVRSQNTAHLPLLQSSMQPPQVAESFHTAVRTGQGKSQSRPARPFISNDFAKKSTDSATPVVSRSVPKGLMTRENPKSVSVQNLHVPAVHSKTEKKAPIHGRTDMILPLVRQPSGRGGKTTAKNVNSKRK